MSTRLTLVVIGPTLKLPLLLMASKTRLASVEVIGQTWPALGPSCKCLAEFFREEFAKHSRCLEEQREYYSELAIMQAEDALAKIMSELDKLCQRDDACEVVGQLLRQLDVVTNLSAWTEVHTLH